MERRGKLTERSLYPALIDVIRQFGGTGAQEIQFNSVPDVIFQLHNRRWLLSVKIGEDARTLKDAFIQYLRHKEESGIVSGLLLMFPQSIRSTKPDEASIRLAISQSPTTCLIDTDVVKDELRNQSFPAILDFINAEVAARLGRREYRYYPLSLVISLLQQQVTEMMESIALDENALLEIIANRDLLMDIGHLKQNEIQSVGHFLASYILMSQVLFLRLFVAARPEIVSPKITPINHHNLRKAFGKILEINYKPIYSVDILDSIPEQFLKDVFDLIWGLEIENVRHDLPGRIFHELMPFAIRKMLAAFYTRPLAADMLAQLTIEHSNSTVFDPACGSGTILVAAYKQKLALFGGAGNPHKRFCEEEIFGADLMPFAVHLASANLASMEVATTIAHTQIIQGDSLKLATGRILEAGLLQSTFWPQAAEARRTEGEAYEVEIKKVDTVLMNPPFTKVERGIRHFVDMTLFEGRVGGEVGLWGHFIALADELLRAEGIFGGVIPINILRGRESARARQILFREWTPLYILKATRNYGFSEWSEYRDVLLIVQKTPAPQNWPVKFALVKRDLTQLTDDQAAEIVETVKSEIRFRSDYLDINSYPLEEISERTNNLMWFCGGVDFKDRDLTVNFISKFSQKLKKFPPDYFREGYRSSGGASKFLYATRNLSHQEDDPRTEEAFLQFIKEDENYLYAQSTGFGVTYKIERNALAPSLRTGVGVATMDITNKWDYIAYKPYKELTHVQQAAGINPSKDVSNTSLLKSIQRNVKARSGNLILSIRINPFSPSVHFPAFFSDSTVFPSDQMKSASEPNLVRGKAVCGLLNSVIFLANFFLLKEESTGRYIHIRSHDTGEMALLPDDDCIGDLAEVFDKYKNVGFPALRHQFDTQFDERYEEFWEQEGGRAFTARMFSVLNQPIAPAKERLDFDRDVCQALGVLVSDDELTRIYEAFVREMILVRRLARD